MKKLKNIFNKYNATIWIIVVSLLSIVLLSFYPGIMSIDGTNQWNQVMSGNIIKNHPFFSTFFWWLLSKIWNSTTVLFVFQILLVASIWTYLCSVLRTKENFKFLVMYSVIICFIPVIFLYSITAWKDIIYSYNLLLLAILMFIGVKKNYKYSYFQLFLIAISLIWINNYRYNGIIVVALMLVTLGIIFFKNRMNKGKIIALILMLISIFGITKVPELVMYKEENISNNRIGSLDDIEMYILTTYVANDKIDDTSDLEVINKVYPIDKIKEEYHPYVINNMSYSKYYNRDAYSENKKQVKNILIKYIMKNPKTLIKHYTNVDNLLFGLNCERDNACYLYMYEFSNWDSKYSGNFDKITKPIFKGGYKFYLKIVNRSFNSDLGKIIFMPAFSLYLSIIICTYIVVNKNKKEYFLCLIPMIYNTISLMPINIAQDARYALINYLTLILLIIPIGLFDKKEKKIEKRCKVDDEARVLVMVPAYNEALNIEKTIKDIEENSNYDYIIINDNSKDNTKEICEKNKFNYISLPVNYGLSSAIQLGMKYALENNYNIAVQFDGDGQHSAKYLNKLVETLVEDKADIAIGSRFVNCKKPFSMRMLGSRLITFVIKLVTNIKICDPTSGMRAYNQDAIREIAQNDCLTPEPDTMVYFLKRGYKIKEVQVKMSEREFGESYLNTWKSIEYMVNMIFSIIFIRAFTNK